MERRNFSFPMPSFLRNSRNNMKNEDSAVILPPNSPESDSVEVLAVRLSPSKPLTIANNSSPKHSSIASPCFASPKLPSSPFYNGKSSSSPSLTVGGPPLALSNPFRQMSNVRTFEGTPRSFVTANRLFSGSPSESRASFQTPSFKIKQEFPQFSNSDNDVQMVDEISRQRNEEDRRSVIQLTEQLLAAEKEHEGVKSQFVVEKESMQKLLDASEKKVEALEAQFDKMTASYTTATNELDQKADVINELQEQLQASCVKSVNVERDLENRTQELLDTQQSLHMAEELRKVAQKDVASLEIKIRSLEEQLFDLQVVFDSADAKRLALEEKTSCLLGLNSTLESKIAVFEVKTEEMTADLAKYEEAIAEISKEKTNLEVSFKTSQEELIIRIRELESAMITLKEQDSAMLQDLQQQLNEAQSKLDHTNEELTTACQRTGLLSKENESLHSNLKTLRMETNATEAKLRTDLDEILEQLTKEKSLHMETTSLLENTRDNLETTEDLLSSLKIDLAKAKEKSEELTIQNMSLEKVIDGKNVALEEAEIKIESSKKSFEEQLKTERDTNEKLEKDYQSEKEQVDVLEIKLNQAILDKSEFESVISSLHLEKKQYQEVLVKIQEEHAMIVMENDSLAQSKITTEEQIKVAIEMFQKMKSDYIEAVDEALFLATEVKQLAGLISSTKNDAENVETTFGELKGCFADIFDELQLGRFDAEAKFQDSLEELQSVKELLTKSSVDCTKLNDANRNLLTETNELKAFIEKCQEKIKLTVTIQEELRVKNSSLREYAAMLGQQNEQLKSRFAALDSELMKSNAKFQELTESSKTLSTQFESSQTEIAALRKRSLSDLKKQETLFEKEKESHEKTKSELESSRIHLEISEHKLNNALVEVGKLEKKIKSLVDDESLRALKREKNLLETKLTIAERNHESSLEKVSSLEGSLRGSENQLLSLQRQLEMTKADLSKAIGFNNQNKEVRGQLSTLRTQSALAQEKIQEQLEECRRNLEKESTAHAVTKQSLKVALDRLDVKLVDVVDSKPAKGKKRGLSDSSPSTKSMEKGLSPVTALQTESKSFATPPVPTRSRRSAASVNKMEETRSENLPMITEDKRAQKPQVPLLVITKVTSDSSVPDNFTVIKKELSPRASTRADVRNVPDAKALKEPIIVDIPVASPNKFFTSREPRTPAVRTYGKPRPSSESPGNGQTASASKKRRTTK